MSTSYFVRYRGRFGDPARFHDYNAGAHARILAELPAIRSLVLHQPAPWRDPFPVNPGEAAPMARISFDSAQALDDALASGARIRARDGFANVAEFEGTATHPATQAKEIF